VAAPFFHADVNADNLLVLRDGRVGFLDFGIVGRIPPTIWAAVQKLSGGLGECVWRIVAQAVVEMGATREAVDVDRLAADIEALAIKFQTIDPQLTATVAGGEVRAQVSVDSEAVTRLALEIAEAAEGAGVKLPRELGFLVQQALCFDRYTRLLAPKLDVMIDDRVSLRGKGAIDV
jgi:aarF domain-containing kinase